MVQLADAQDFLALTGACWLHLDIDSGRIAECNELAAGLLGEDVATLRGRPWRDLLCSKGAAEELEHAICAGVRCTLVPFILRRAQLPDVVVGGMVLPAASAVSLLLWPLLDQGLRLPEDIVPADVIAVLGIEQLATARSGAAADRGALIQEIRSSLFGILRNRDHIAQPVDGSVVLVLKAVSLDDGQDICRALLSHLHSGSALNQQQLAQIRLSVGLAAMSSHPTALDTLLAANNALLRLQYSEGSGRIRVASADDGHYLSRLAANPYALFSGSPALSFSSVRSAGVDPGTTNNTVPMEGAPLERGIEGYVVDNMEGAVDQAIFLANLDIPIAIIGASGTGKLYIAKIIQQQSLAAGDALVVMDCREFRSRGDANKRIAAALENSAGKTLVFKSPQLMSQEVQIKLARQLSSRTLADVSPPRYLPKNQLVALFPDELERLMAQGKLTPQLASVFGGYPIHIPPIRDRKQAVLRWAHKMLEQEGRQRQRNMRGFTPDAEQAMLVHDWPGNITEMRQCITDALDKTDKDWITPVDLGLFKGIRAEGAPYQSEPLPFLSALQREEQQDDSYVPSSMDALDLALGEAVNNLVAGNRLRPLGIWAEDDMVLAALDRYREDRSKAALLLHTRARNISRWLPKIRARDEQRNSLPLWQDCRRLLREWIRESPLADDSPLVQVQGLLLAHVERHTGATTVTQRAGILGVSVPTYHKRLRSEAGAAE